MLLWNKGCLNETQTQRARNRRKGVGILTAASGPCLQQLEHVVVAGKTLVEGALGTKVPLDGGTSGPILDAEHLDIIQ